MKRSVTCGLVLRFGGKRRCAYNASHRRRGGGASDSESRTFFAYVGVDLEARWELNKGVCTGIGSPSITLEFSLKFREGGVQGEGTSELRLGRMSVTVAECRPSPKSPTSVPASSGGNRVALSPESYLKRFLSNA